MAKDYAATLFDEPAEAETKEKDWVGLVMAGEPVGGTFAPTAEISTITGKPVKKYVPSAAPEASFGALLESGFADDPVTKIKILAEKRGISPTRYRQGSGGQIEFKNDEGKWQRELSEMPTSQIKGLAAEIVGHPGTYLGPLGARYGVLGAGSGAMVGELARKGIGKGVYGEKVSPVQDLFDVGLQGVVAMTGAGLGKIVTGAINRGMSSRAGILQRAGYEASMGTLTPAEHAKAAWLQQLADKFDIKLTPAQLYDREGLINTWKYLRKHPSTSDIVGKFEKELDKSTDDAIQKFIREMGGFTRQPSEVGSDLARSAEMAITRKEGVRGLATEPMYQSAFSRAQEVELGPAINNLNRMIENYPEGNIQRTLMGIRKSLTKVVEPEGGAEAVSHRQAATRVPETELSKIQKALFELDDLIEGTSYEAAKISPSSKKVLNRGLMQLKADILDAAGRASPEFIQANKKFAELSPPIEKLKNSVIGELTRMQKDSVISKAPRKLMDIENMPDAQLLRSAKMEIGAQNPGLWKEMVGQYIRDIYERMLVTEDGNVANAAGKLYKNLFGNERRRQIMEAAMDQQDFTVFKDLMEVMNRAAVGRGKESMTAPFLQIQKQLEPQLGSQAFGLMQQPKETMLRWTLGKWNETMMAGRQVQLFDALTSQDAIERISRIKRMSPGSQELIRELATLMAMATEKTRGTNP